MNEQTDILEAPTSYTYAQINDEGICVGVSQLSGKVIQANMIDVTDTDNPFELFGLKHTKAGAWEPESVIEPELSESPEPVTLESLQRTIDRLEEKVIAMATLVTDAEVDEGVRSYAREVLTQAVESTAVRAEVAERMKAAARELQERG